jgi:hypothetical protein
MMDERIQKFLTWVGSVGITIGLLILIIVLLLR